MTDYCSVGRRLWYRLTHSLTHVPGYDSPADQL